MNTENSENIGFIDLQPLLDASFAIQVHVVFALISFVVGAMILWRRKGGPSHKKWGKFWVVTMGLTALTSFFISELKTFGYFSPIHLLSMFTLVSLYLAIKHIRAGNVKAHKLTMQGLYGGGMLVAGGLTFTSGKRMHKVFVDPIEVHFGLAETSSGIGLVTWLVPIVGTVFVILFLNREVILGLIRTR